MADGGAVGRSRADISAPIGANSPRGRRGFTDDLADRVQALRSSEVGASAAAMLAWVRDVILLLKDLAADERVSRLDKFAAVAAAAYLMSPVDLVPDALPFIGQLDDLGVVALAVRRLLGGAGYHVIAELWRGSDEGLALLLTLAGVQE